MRKILTSVLGVAGLMAVVLAVSAGPATAQAAKQRVITFTSGTDPGTYTMSWVTSGGCDPSSPGGDVKFATDAQSGSKSMVVRNPGDVNKGDSVHLLVAGLKDTDGNRYGQSATQSSLSIGTHCAYNFEYSFTSSLPASRGIACDVTADPALIDIEATDDVALSIRVDATTAADCGENGKIAVSVEAPSPAEGDPADPNAALNLGAIKGSVFTVTATPVKDSHDECLPVTVETEINDQDTDDKVDDTVEAEIVVVQTTLEDKVACAYDVVVDVPGGFDAPEKSNEGSAQTNVDGVTDPNPDSAILTQGGTAVALTLENCGDETYSDALVSAADGIVVCDDVPEVTATFIVATRTVYILQNVVGDSENGQARYTLTEDKSCGIPDDLPDPLTGSGGIDTIKAQTVVELREGYFNISGAVLGANPDDEIPNAPRLALNEEADTCVVTAKLSELPGHCSAEASGVEADLVSGVDDKGRAIIRFDITCGAAADDMDSGDTDSGDMDSGDMDSGDMDSGDTDSGDTDSGDMDSGDMDSGDTDSGDTDSGDTDSVGPREDVPTG